ncbi:MAG: tetratricopeptide repeat protein [Desulfitobacterium sp.]
MGQVKYDLQVLYVYKLYYFFSIFIFFILTGLFLWWRFGPILGVCSLLIGFSIAYLLMMRKRSFPPPDKKSTAQKMAKEITQGSTPLAISHFASQLYFYFRETRQAIALLEKYQNTNDPLLCATLADLLLREDRPKHALNIIQKNPNFYKEPLLLIIHGHILQHMNKWQEAIDIYEQSLDLAHKTGFPHNGTDKLTQFLLSLSYTATLHHSLGDCYVVVRDYSKANKHYILGNIRFFDISLWRKLKSPVTYVA